MYSKRALQTSDARPPLLYSFVRGYFFSCWGLIMLLHYRQAFILRLRAASFTVRWHEQTALKVCARNIDKLSAGGTSRSRCLLVAVIRSDPTNRGWL